MDRNRTLLTGLDKTMLGLEIGAGFKPAARKADGWNVRVVDHATRSDLQAKYLDQPYVDVNQIEDVDIIWNTQALHDCVPPEQRNQFDFCLASHVVEHIPDLLTFFHSMEALLKPNGVLSLAVPDKRFSFDAFKPISTTADILYAHVNRHLATRHSGKTKFENIAYNVTSGDARCWEQKPLNELSIFSPLVEAKNVIDTASEDPAAPYADCHAWYFTPSSFRLIIMELRALGRTRLHIEELSPTEGAEFFVRMRLDAPTDAAPVQPSKDERLALMVAILAEQAYQYSLLGDALLQRLAKLLPAGHPLPDLNLQNKVLDKILNSHSWRLVSAFWTNVDKIKQTLKWPLSPSA